MKIPEVRDEILDIAMQLEHDHGMHVIAEKLRVLEEQLWRRPYVRKCRDKSHHATPELYAQLRAAAQHFPNLTYQEIASMHGVSAGRVSEAMAGKRR